MKPKAIYAGSFNPLHLGHIDIIKKANKLFDLTLVIAQNPEKPERDHKIIDRQIKFMRESLAQHTITLPIEVLKHNTLLVDYAEKNGFEYLIRSFRNGSEADSELLMAWANEGIGGIQTVFIMPDKELLYYSSTLCRVIDLSKKG